MLTTQVNYLVFQQSLHLPTYLPPFNDHFPDKLWLASSLFLPLVL